jgi:excisionase family DNA binding protein
MVDGRDEAWSAVRGSDVARPVTRADVLKAREVAEILGVPESTVADWARRGVIPSRKRGRRRFYLRWEVEAWLMADDAAAA